jgi:Tol biopolymer transport system component
MTTPSRLERNLAGILDDLSAGPTPGYLDDLFLRTGRMRQRPAWTFPERWLPMSDITRPRAYAFAPPWRTIAVALVVLALLVGAAFVYVGSRQQRVPAPFGPAGNGLIPYVSAGDLFVGDPVTGSTRLLVGGPEDDAAPSFSPDGTRVAFIRDVPGAGAGPRPVDLYVVRQDGSDLRRITSAPIQDLVAATWTPDGRHLAVVHPADITNTGSPPTNQLYLLDATGSQPPIRLAAAAGLDSIVFRPTDGGEILFRALVAGQYGLFVMNVDGTNVRTLREPNVPTHFDQHLDGLTYSPDGARIFYQSYVSGTDGTGGGCCQLWVMNADGTDQHQFVQDPAAPNGWQGEPAISPDGKWIAFDSLINDGPTPGVAIVRADGTGPVIRTGPELTSVAHWLWSPDSSKILMMPSEGGNGSAYLLDPAGGPWTNVAWTSDIDLDWQRLAP